MEEANLVFSNMVDVGRGCVPDGLGAAPQHNIQVCRKG